MKSGVKGGYKSNLTLLSNRGNHLVRGTKNTQTQYEEIHGNTKNNHSEINSNYYCHKDTFNFKGKGNSHKNVSMFCLSRSFKRAFIVAGI